MNKTRKIKKIRKKENLQITQKLRDIPKHGSSNLPNTIPSIMRASPTSLKVSLLSRSRTLSMLMELRSTMMGTGKRRQKLRRRS